MASPNESRPMQITTEATNSSPPTDVVRTALLARLEWRISSMTAHLEDAVDSDQGKTVSLIIAIVAMVAMFAMPEDVHERADEKEKVRKRAEHMPCVGDQQISSCRCNDERQRPTQRCPD